MIIPPSIAGAEPPGPILETSTSAAGSVLNVLTRTRAGYYRLEWPGTAQPPPEARLIEQLVGEREVEDALDATTDHAWLVVLGHFAQAVGLVH